MKVFDLINKEECISVKNLKRRVLIYRVGLNWGIKKQLLIPVAIVIIFISLWAYFFWYPALVMDHKIEQQRIVVAQYVLFALKFSWHSSSFGNF